MGDRVVFGFKKDTNDLAPVWLYSHWGASSAVKDMGEAIAKARPRWNDPAYATRIATSHIIGTDWNQELHFGITAGFDNMPAWPDDERIYIACWEEKMVQVVNFSDPRHVIRQFSFEDFLTAVLAGVL